MGSVGNKRQYETEAIYDFAMLVKILSELHYPESKELQELARRAKLTFIMAATTEQNDLKTGSIFRDRLQDCETCKRWSNDQTCERNGHFTGPCKYSSAAYKAKAIRDHFGMEAIEIIKKYPIKEIR